MPFPDELVRADLVWAIETNKEIAVNTLWLQHHHVTGNTFTWPAAVQKIADKIMSTFTDSGGSATQMLSHVVNNVGVSRVDVYQVDSTGHAAAKGTASPSSPVTGSASGNYVPLMGAVLQLWGMPVNGFASHPRRRRGRLFLPGTPTSVFANTGELSQSTADTIAADCAAWLNDLQGMNVGDDSQPIGTPDWMNTGVMSRVDGAFYQLEAVTCAFKPGVQRRRMNKLSHAHGAGQTIHHS